MGANTAIEWTDHTFNGWLGCTKVHAGCTHCYAETMSKRTGKAIWGPQGTRVKTSEQNWRQPLKWNREAEKEGIRRRVFCASMADVFEDWKGLILDHKGATVFAHSDGCLCPAEMRGDRPATLDDLRRCLFSLIDATPWLDWQLVTKRPENIRRKWPLRQCCGYNAGGLAAHCSGCGESLQHRKNVWLITSVSNQETADRMIPELLKCRDLAPVLGLSCEPLLGPIELGLPPINWVHPDEDDDGKAAMERIGCQIGEEFLLGGQVEWRMPELSSRYAGDGLWNRGRLVVHTFHRYRLDGWHTPEYGDCDKGMVRTKEQQGVNVVIGGMRTGNIAGDPTLKWPIAKAPPRTLDWVIVGGESGGGAQPCNVESIRSIVRQCQAAGVPCFVKQLGAKPFDSSKTPAGYVDRELTQEEIDADPEGVAEELDAYRRAMAMPFITDRKGGDWREWPPELRVREFPGQAAAV